MPSFSDIQEARPRRLAELEARRRVMQSRGKTAPTVLMTADAVGGVWSYALTLCARAAGVRFVLATMGPAPERGATRDRCAALGNVVLEEAPYRLEWMDGRGRRFAGSRRLARRAGATAQRRPHPYQRLRPRRG